MRALRGAASQAMVRAVAAAHWVTLVIVLGGCVPAALERGGPPVAQPPVLTAFEVDGRLSMRHGSDALAASFRWRHADERDELQFASPLGQTIAVLSGDSSQVRLQAADGRVSAAGDWGTLTEQGLGWPLPVQGLSFWIQGSSRPDTPFTLEAGEDGRVTVLRQDGWTIVYQAYAPTADASWRPSRLVLSYPDVELRIAIDRWQ
ncbi:MAG TPA: lipoprotein insertase outer membrane protein LolB [Casimicrobiaceae bacterium]|jgi:outer membrane lipoprotein LolB|nr:lipoprotein insertase outer membrane protein LolB [Casimicrobiaceae bacterium]